MRVVDTGDEDFSGTRADAGDGSDAFDSLVGFADRLESLTVTVQTYVDAGPERAVTQFKVSLLWIAYGLVLSGAVLAGVRWVVQSALPPPHAARADAQVERLSAIVDVLDVPRTAAYRTSTGAPRTAVVQRALDDLEAAGTIAPVRGVTAREVAAACLQAPRVCAP